MRTSTCRGHRVPLPGDLRVRLYRRRKVTHTTGSLLPSRSPSAAVLARVSCVTLRQQVLAMAICLTLHMNQQQQLALSQRQILTGLSLLVTSCASDTRHWQRREGQRGKQHQPSPLATSADISAEQARTRAACPVASSFHNRSPSVAVWWPQFRLLQVLCQLQLNGETHRRDSAVRTATCARTV